VTVIVGDVNDNSPVFSNASCQIPVLVREVSSLIFYDVNNDVLSLL